MNYADRRFLTECLSNELVKRLMNLYNWDIAKAIDVLYNSQTYAKLENPLTGLYYQSDVYVFSFLQKEIEHGKI